MEKEIGRIVHYFSRLQVGVLEVTGAVVRTGDAVHIQGHTTELYQIIESMQLDGKPVDTAEKGMKIGIKVNGTVRNNDRVYLVQKEN